MTELREFNNGLARSGKFIGQNIQTAEEAIIAANLDWGVEKRKIMFGANIDTEDTIGTIYHNDDYRMIARSDNNCPLGVVSKKYQPVQNTEVFNFMDSLAKDNKVTYHSAGLFDNGQQVWILAKFNEYEAIPNDVLEDYILLLNAHNGSSSMKAVFTNIRLACDNAVMSALRDGRKFFNIRHTKNVHEHLYDASKVLEIAAQEALSFKSFAQHAARATMSEQELNTFVEKLIPIPPTKEQTHPDETPTRIQNKRDRILSLAKDGAGTNINSVRGTRWAAFNAVTEYCNHYKPVRGTIYPAIRRAQTLVANTENNLITKATQLLAA